jgi:CHAD domain-containing protein
MKPQADENYRLLATQYLRKQLKQLAGQFDGIRKGESPELVHHARVASRRLRAGLKIFRGCFPRKAFKQWRKELRHLTADLGAARDQDVQIAFLYDLLEHVEDRACYPGIVRLLGKLEHGRESLQPEVLKAVERLRTSSVLEEMTAAAKALAPDSEKTAAGPHRAIYRQVGEHIVDQFQELLASEDSLSRPDDQAGHHAMRIAAKRLRYTIEICKPLYDDRLDEPLTAIKEVQGLLGEIHDCDVWSERLKAFLEEERKAVAGVYGHDGPAARLQPGIEFLHRERQQQRGDLFRRLVDYWQGLKQTHLWERLVQTVGIPGDAKKELPCGGALPGPAPPSPPPTALPDDNPGAPVEASPRQPPNPNPLDILPPVGHDQRPEVG